MINSVSKTSAALILAAFLSASCSSDVEPEQQQSDTSNQPAADTSSANASSADNSVAKVNDDYISRLDLESYKSQKQAAAPGSVLNDADIIDEMVTIELVKQDAIKAGVDQHEDFNTALTNARNNLLVSFHMKDIFGDIEYSDEELQEEYDAQIAGQGRNEYKAMHVLLENENDAKEVIRQLDEGADFAELAKEKSKDPSAASGGDLGWFQPGTMVKPFAEAIESMEKGAYSKTPVNSQFGWHVIKLEDIRDVPLPTVEEMKNQLVPAITKKKLQAYLDGLKESGSIEILETTEEEKPADPE